MPDPASWIASAAKADLERLLCFLGDQADAEQLETGGVTWDEDQELSLLTSMGWSKCMGTSCGKAAAPSSAPSAAERTSGPDDEMGAGGGGSADASQQLHLEPSHGAHDEDEDDAARQKLELSAEEWSLLEQRKDELAEQRQRSREALKLKFDEFCERISVGPLQGEVRRKATARWAAAAY